MKIRILGFAAIVAVGLVLPAGMSGCNEPQVQCQVGHATSSEYVMTYAVTQSSAGCGDGLCSGALACVGDTGPCQNESDTCGTGTKPKGTCQLTCADGSMCAPGSNAQTICAPSAFHASFFTASQVTGNPVPGNTVSFEDYHPATGVNTRDVSQTTVYIETDDVAAQQAAVECFESDDPDTGYLGQPFQGTDQPWETGSFANQFPDANNLCTLANIQPATGWSGTIPAANPAPSCGSPAASCTQKKDGSWNMECLCTATMTDDCCSFVDPAAGPDPMSCHTSPQAINVAIKYDWQNPLFYTTADAPGTQFGATMVYDDGVCQATVQAHGLWPATDCTMTDIEGNPLEADGKTPLAAGHPPQPNPKACCPNPDTDHGHPSGSGINSNFNVHCDPDLLLCVLNGSAADGVPVLSSGVPDGCDAIVAIQ